MKKSEAEKLATQMAGLFPGSVTQSHRKTMITAFLPRERREIETAIAAYHRTASNLDWTAFWSECEATKPENIAVGKPASNDDFNHAEHIRRTWPQVRGRGDVEVLVRHYRALFWREKIANAINENAIAVSAKRYRRECRVEILELGGITEDHAERLAESISIPPHDFPAVLDDIRRNFAGKASDAAQMELLS